MAFNINERERLSNKERYFFSPKHRKKGNPDASIWTVTFNVEYDLADSGIQNGYVEVFEKRDGEKQAFNLLRSDDKLQVLGYNSKRKDLKIAKFIASVHMEWHGYPADHISNQQDKPNNITLKKLSDSGVISKREMKLISGGKKL